MNYQPRITILIIIIFSIGTLLIIKLLHLRQLSQYLQLKGSSSYVIMGDYSSIHVGNNDTEKLPISQETQVVRSEFKLPHHLLPRQKVINFIVSKFNSHQDQNFIALAGIVGIAGAGKTTIARMVGKYWEEYHPDSHVYEINAETEGTIANSLMDFAVALAQTAQLKEELSTIQQTQDYDSKIHKLYNFIQKILKESKNWLLIFDSVKSIREISSYLPYDKNIWGDGNIIITTRNNNILEDEFLNGEDIIHLDQLSESEAVELFTTIYSHNNKIITDDEISQIKHFLKEIPPFPHDINITARYVRNNHISLMEYSQLLQDQPSKFYKSQEEFIKDVSGYSKSRYRIISLSLEQILNKNQKYKKLLLLCSLLDSQNIPKELLEFVSDQLTTNNLLHELHKYSLITQKAKYGLPTISMHSSTHEMLIKFCRQTANRDIIDDILFLNFQKYVDYIINYESIDMMRILINHIQYLFTTPFVKYQGELYLMLSILLYYTGDFLGDELHTKNYLTQAIKLLEHNKVLQARSLSFLSSVYRRLGFFSKAKKSIQSALDLYRELGDIFGYLEALSFAGEIYRMNEEYDVAKSLLKRSIILSKQYNNISTTLPRSKIYLAIIYKNLGKYYRSEEILQKSLVLYQMMDSNLALNWAKGHLGAIYREQGKYDKAIKTLRTVRSFYKQHGYLRHKSLEWILIDLGAVYNNMGNYDKAKQYFRKSIRLVRQTQKYGFVINLGRNLTHMGKLYHKLGQYDKAQQYFMEGKEEQIKVFGKKSVKTAWVNGEIAKLYIDLGKYDEAEQLVNDNLTIHEMKLPLDHIRFAKQKAILARIYYFQKKYNEAEQLFNTVLAKFEEIFGIDHLRNAEILRYLGEIYLAQNQFELAREFINHSLKILENNNNHPDRFLVYESLAELYKLKAEEYQKKSNYPQAFRNFLQVKYYLKLALDISQNTFSEQSMHIKRITGKQIKVEQLMKRDFQYLEFYNKFQELFHMNWITS